jgi:hypothetical protein
MEELNTDMTNLALEINDYNFDWNIDNNLVLDNQENIKKQKINPTDEEVDEVDEIDEDMIAKKDIDMEMPETEEGDDEEEEEDGEEDGEEEDEEEDNRFSLITHINDNDSMDIKDLDINEEFMNPNYLNNIKKELKDDLDMFNNIVKEQNKLRLTILKRVISSSYIKKETNLSSVIIIGLNRLAESFELESMLGAVIADILFNDKIVELKQIKKYEDVLKPFLISSISQENFLNQLLVLFEKYNNLVEPHTVNIIFKKVVKHNLVNGFVLSNWYNSLNDNCNEDYFTISSNLKNAIYCFLNESIDS